MSKYKNIDSLKDVKAKLWYIPYSTAFDKGLGYAFFDDLAIEYTSDKKFLYGKMDGMLVWNLLTRQEFKAELELRRTPLWRAIYES